MPGYGTVLSCHCFSHEECGDYAVAEPSGRAAIEIDPGDVWGTHAVAHIMEMQGRHAEGIAWLDELERHWEGGSNLLHHLWWHRALFHLERGEFDAVLDLYDRRFRNLTAPLTQAQPDLYIDVQNAASMLFRLERLGIDVGDALDRNRRQGGGAHRRLPLGLHAAALDDGARRRRTRRCGAAHARRDACIRQRRGDRGACRRQRRAADQRSGAGASQGQHASARST